MFNPRWPIIHLHQGGVRGTRHGVMSLCSSGDVQTDNETESAVLLMGMDEVEVGGYRALQQGSKHHNLFWQNRLKPLL